MVAAKEAIMQIISGDWKQKFEELHYKTLEAYEAAERSTGSFNAASEDPSYIAACEAVADFINQTFGSYKSFDGYMKADFAFQAKAKGYNGQVPPDWDGDELPKAFSQVTIEAESMWMSYKHIYINLTNKVSFLPQKPAPSNTTLEYHA